MFSELITNRENTIIILHSLSLIFFQLRHLLSVKKLNSCKKSFSIDTGRKMQSLNPGSPTSKRRRLPASSLLQSRSCWRAGSKGGSRTPGTSRPLPLWSCPSSTSACTRRSEECRVEHAMRISVIQYAHDFQHAEPCVSDLQTTPDISVVSATLNAGIYSLKFIFCIICRSDNE